MLDNTTIDSPSNRESFDGSIDLEYLLDEQSNGITSSFDILSGQPQISLFPDDTSSNGNISSQDGKSSDLTDSADSQSSSDSDESKTSVSTYPIRSIGGFGKYSTPQSHTIRQTLSEKNRHLLAALSCTFVQNIEKAALSPGRSFHNYVYAGGTKEEFNGHVRGLEESGIEELYITESNKGCFPTPFMRRVLGRNEVRALVREGIAAPRADFLMPEECDETPLDPKPFLATALHAATREEFSLYESYAMKLDAYKYDSTRKHITRNNIESLFLQTITIHNFCKLDIDIYHFFYCIDYIDIDKSLEALSFGNNPINKSGEVMHFHHVTQQEGKDAYMVLISGSIHQELHARIHFENTHKFRHQSVDRMAYTANRTRVCEKLREEIEHIQKLQEKPKARPKVKAVRKKRESRVSTSIASEVHHENYGKPVKTKRDKHLDDAFTIAFMPPMSKAALNQDKIF